MKSSEPVLTSRTVLFLTFARSRTAKATEVMPTSVITFTPSASYHRDAIDVATSGLF